MPRAWSRRQATLRRQYFGPVARRPGIRRVHRDARCGTASCRSSLLSFEVTETAAVANIVRAEALIRRLRELGCAVALDDFGRGLSSLTYLKTLPVTHLKIDGSFVRDVVDGRAVAGHAERDRAARPGHETEDHRRMRRKRRDLRR